MTATLVTVMPGMVIAFGIVLAILAFRPLPPRLDDALAALADSGPAATEPEEVPTDERVGAWWLHRRGGRVSVALARRLQLKGISVTRFYSDKLIYAAGGFFLPLLLGVLAALTGEREVMIPAVASIVGAAVGFFLPDLRLRQDAPNISADATESVLTFYDLVTLERMANQSATQSLHAAAALSDTAVFSTIRGSLERARLEQRMPFGDLKDLGQRMELPALVDLAEVMRLDETGASLSGTLRARVKELRDAHLTAMKMAANDASERMTVFMVIPSLIFGLIFLIPPLLKLVST
ncbi:hypothetical protein [Nigerium massiliense]|uniref:hypothetical protein n=1 Tax=Nigerium massiliense TaxID=1522317 RepID=UPI00058B1BD3|nr:hypothetical protein [Nigerium massiliense]